MVATLAKGEDDVERVITLMEDSGLRGLIGVGFLAGRKWRTLKEQAARADERRAVPSEALGIETCCLYLRDEHHGCREMLMLEIAKLLAMPPRVAQKLCGLTRVSPTSANTLGVRCSSRLTPMSPSLTR